MLNLDANKQSIFREPGYLNMDICSFKDYSGAKNILD